MACKRRAPPAGLALLLLALLLSGNVHQAEGFSQLVNKAIYKGCPWSHERALEADLRSGYGKPDQGGLQLDFLNTVDMCRFANEISGADTAYRRIVNGIGLGPAVDNQKVKFSYVTTPAFAIVRVCVVSICGGDTVKEYLEVLPGGFFLAPAGGALLTLGKKAATFFEGLADSSKAISRIPLGPVKIAAKAVNLAASPPKSTFGKLGKALDDACPKGGKLFGAFRKLFRYYGLLQASVTFFDGVVLPTSALTGCKIYDAGMTPLALRRARANGVSLTTFAGPSTARCLPHFATTAFSGSATPSRRRGRQLLAGPNDFPTLQSLPAWNNLTKGLEEIDGTLSAISNKLSELEARWTEVNTWANEASDKLGKITKPLEPVEPVFKSLEDIFKYLECPKWLSCLCNLDDLLTSLIDALFEALGIPPISEWIDALLREIGLGPVIDLAKKADDLLTVFDADLEAQFDQLVGKINATIKARFGPLLSVDAWVKPAPDNVVVVDSKLWVRNLRLNDGAAATIDCRGLGVSTKPFIISAERDIEGCTQDFAKFIRIPCGNTDRFCTIDYNARYPTSCANVPRAVPADLAAELASFFGVAKLPSTDVTTISYFCVEPTYKLDLLAELFNGIGVDPAVLRGFGDVLRADPTKVPNYITSYSEHPTDVQRNTSVFVKNLRSGGNYGAFRAGSIVAPAVFDVAFGVAPVPALPNAVIPGFIAPSLGLYEGSTVVGEISCGARQIYLEGTQAAASPGQGGFDPCFSYNWLINDKDDTECPTNGAKPYECVNNGLFSIINDPNQFYNVWPLKWDLCRRVWSKQLDNQFVYDSRRWPLPREPALGPSADYTYKFADGTTVIANPQRYGAYSSAPTPATASETWDCEGTTLFLVVWRGFTCPGNRCTYGGQPQECTDAVAVLPDYSTSPSCKDWIQYGPNVEYVINTVKNSAWRCADTGAVVDLSGPNNLELTCRPWSADATARFCRAGYPNDFALGSGESGLGFNLPLENWPPATAPNTTYWAQPFFVGGNIFNFIKFGFWIPSTKLSGLVKKQYDRGASHPDVAPCVGLEDRVRQRCKNGQHSCKPYDGETTGCRLPRLQWSCVEPEVFATEGTPVRLEYAFGDSLRASTPKNVTCPGGSLASVTDAAFGAVFTFEDVTDLLQPKCSGSTCLFTAADGVRNAGDTASGKVLRVRIFCACGAGRVPGLQPNGTCLLCAPGSYRNASMDACQLCPPGTFSTGGATACTPCSRGQYAPDAGSSGCQTCRQGTVGAGEGFVNETDACIPCPVNTYAPSTNASSCTPCAPGASTFGRDQQISCLSCGAGFVRPAGAASCTACLPGTFSPDNQAAECRPCGRGNYSADVAATQCSLCRIGAYQDQEGQTECKVCPNDTRTAGFGSTSAADCYRPKEIDFDEELRIFLQSVSGPPPGGYNASLCDTFLAQFNGTGNTTEKRLGQLNNGFCNKGPFNTAICDFDGGDCCAATCVKRTLTQLNATTDEFGNVTGFTNVTVPWPASCADYTLACKNPATLKLGAPAGCRALRIEKAGTEAAANATCNATDPRIGNGKCDDELNLAACAYDGGDCCRATCQRNEGLAGSCIESNCRDPAVVNAAKFVDVVAPTIFGVPVDLRVQYTDPRFDALTALPTGLAASDNDPCYVSNVALVLNQTIRDRSKLPSGTLFRFVRVWRAVDASGNAANATQVVDALDVPLVNSKPSVPTLLSTPKSATATWQCDAVQAPPTVTASEAGNAMSVRYTEARVNGSCAGSYTLRRRWVATNVAGRSTTFNQIITVVDTTPPRSLTPPNPNWAVCVFAQPGKFGRIGSVSTDARFAFNRVADACSGVRPGVFVSCVPDTPVNTTASCTYNSATNTLTVPAALQPRVGRFDQPAFWRVTWRVRDGCDLATTLVQRVQVRPRARFDPPTACVTPS